MKVEKNLKKSVKIALVFLAIGLLLGTLIAFAATPSSTFYISSGVYPGAPSYTIWKEGSNYFAKDANGMLKYSGTSFPTLIQSCINALTGGGIIYLLPGQYYNNGVEVNITNNGISIIGSGYGTQWINNVGSAVSSIVVRGTANFRIENFLMNSLVVMTSGAAIACEDAWIRVAPGDPDRIGTVNVIKNMIIENQYEAIRFDNSTWVFCQDIDIRNPYAVGVVINLQSAFIYLTRVMVFGYAHNYSTSLHLKSGFSIYCLQNEFLSASKYGVLCDPDPGVLCEWLFFTDVRVECNESLTEGNAFEFSENNGGDIQGVYMQNCWAVSGMYGIVLIGVEEAQLDNCQVHGNGKDGVYIANSTNTKGIQITGGHYSVNSQAWNNTYSGIHVCADVSYFSIIGAHFYGHGIYTETGTVHQGYAITVDAGTSNWYQIIGNLCVDNSQTPQISDGGTGANKTVANNTQ